MPIQQRFCVNHPQRPAIGLCVMTRRPICGECSTRYEGVNYSKEGLELLKKQRSAAAEARHSRLTWAVLAWALSPLLLYLMYLGFLSSAACLMNLLRGEIQRMPGSFANPTELVDLLETQGPCTAPLDAAAEYMRRRIERVGPLYVFAMLPHAIIAAMLIQAIVGERRSLVAQYCIYLTGAMIWRWFWLARLQRQVQQDLHAQTGATFGSRIFQMILVRLYCNCAITWGSLLVGVPAFYGLFLGSFATPLLLEDTQPAFPRLKQALSWIQYFGQRLFRICLAMSAIGILMLVALLVSQQMLSRMVLPSLLGVDTADLELTLNSWAWRLGILYFVFLILDCYWTVASVVLYYDSQSRRMATDLRARLAQITGE